MARWGQSLYETEITWQVPHPLKYTDNAHVIYADELEDWSDKNVVKTTEMEGGQIEIIVRTHELTGDTFTLMGPGNVMFDGIKQIRQAQVLGAASKIVGFDGDVADRMAQMVENTTKESIQEQAKIMVDSTWEFLTSIIIGWSLEEEFGPDALKAEIGSDQIAFFFLQEIERHLSEKENFTLAG